MTHSPPSTLVDDERPKARRPRWWVTVVAVAGRIVSPATTLLDGPIVQVGRGPDNALELDDPRVSRQHCSLELKGAEAILTVAGRSPVRVDGRAVTAEATLGELSTLVLGASAFVLRRGVPDTAPIAKSYGLIGQSPSMRSVQRTIELVGPTPSSVLIQGESGTGKELVARALHEASRRRGPLVAVNTSAIPATLAEAHLFGHVAGAFTGATSAAPGVFRAADGGTLFLDEIADLPVELQPKLLRVLEDRLVTPVGTTRGHAVDVRVVSATNQDLVHAVDVGKFRGDLYARLSDFTLALPPLRERPEDVLALLARDLGSNDDLLSPDLIADLLSRPWRFNVRELRKIGTQLRVRRVAGEPLTREMIDAAAPAATETEAAPAAEPATAAAKSAVPTKDELDSMLRKHAGVVEFVARDTGRSRRQVHRWMEKFGLDVEDYRKR